MYSPAIPRLTALPALVILGTLMLLPGCACDPNRGAWHPNGQVATPDGKPFNLADKNQRLVIAPGNLTITAIDNDCAPRLEIGNSTGRLVIALHRGEMTGNEIRIVGVTHGLSANLLGNWHDIAQGQPHEIYTTESCSTYGYCAKPETEKECHDGKCKTETHMEYGYHSDCPGSRPLTIRYDYFKRFYRLAFLNPQNTREQFGTYEGLTAAFEGEVGRLAGVCIAH